jgi:uncharacterized protein (TIGR03382 family)
VQDVNTKPVARAGTAQTAPERTQVTLDGRGSTDADPSTVLRYTWTQVGTPTVALIGNGSAQPAFMAPEVDAAGVVLTFSLVVSDGQLDSQPATVQVTVTNVNRPPLASAGTSITRPERSEVALTATGSDPDGDTLSYAWVQLGSPRVTLSGADTSTPIFTTPEVTASTDLVFEVTVSDGSASVTSQVTVTVENVNRSPVANAGPSQTVNEGTLVHMDAGGSTDPDGGQLYYSWIQIEGPGVTLTGAESSGPSFTAPGGDTRVVFQVTVSDGQLFSSATATVNVLKVPSSGGCGCSAYDSNPASLVPFLFGLAFLRRRRARPSAR